MRPASAQGYARARLTGAPLRAVAAAELRPRGPGFAPALRLRRPVFAFRGGVDAIVVTFAWAAGAVRMRVLAAGACTSDDVDAAIEAGRRITAVDDDPTDFLAAVKDHPIVGQLARRADTRLETTPTVFEAYALGVIEQLVTGEEARASIRRLWRVAGERVPQTSIVAAPTATAVKRVPMWQMHALGIGARRAVTLHNGAARGAALERLRDVPPDVAFEKLQTLPGIGPWTANYVARKAFGWADAVPVGDFWSPFLITAALTGEQIPRAERDAADAAMLSLLEPFRPHRARVARVLERHAMATSPVRRPRVDPHRREPWRY